jgi:hypothetical protein
MWISWKHEDTQLSWPLTFEQKVELFCEQALGWQLHIADLVANGGTTFGEDKLVSSIRHSGFAVLQICLSCFETIGHYTGDFSGSKAAFRNGVFEVFPDLNQAGAVADRFVDALSRDARCGLYHNVRTARVGLGQPPDGAAVAYDRTSGLVVISPERLPRALRGRQETSTRCHGVGLG